MKDVTLTLSGMLNKEWDLLQRCMVSGDILGVCRVMYFHLRRSKNNMHLIVDTKQKEVLNSKKELENITTVEDMERAWTK